MKGTPNSGKPRGKESAQWKFIISLFCTKVLHVGNPFSPQAMLKIASTGALGNGIARLASRQARTSMYRRAVGFGRKQGHRMGLGTRSRMGTGTASSRIAEQASRQQYGTLPPGTDQAAQTVATDMSVPPGAPGTPTAGTPRPDTPNGPAGNPPRSPAPGGWLPTGVPAVSLRTHAGNIAKGAIKLGAAGAGAAALGGEALALPCPVQPPLRRLRVADASGRFMFDMRQSLARQFSVRRSKI